MQKAWEKTVQRSALGRVAAALWLAILGSGLSVAAASRAAAADPPDVEAKIAGLDVAIWLPTGSLGPRPLVLFSHGFGGCKTQSTYLMRALARHGMLVAAPDHKDEGAGCPQRFPELSALPAKFYTPGSWSDKDYEDRRRDLEALRAALPTAPELSGWSLDPKRVVLVGHSLGGYTVLGLDGAWPGWKMPGIAAVVALAPYAEPFLNPAGALGRVSAPVLYQVGDLDKGITWPVVKSNGVFAATAKPACKVSYALATHFAWTDLPLGIPFQAATAAATLAFLDEVLAGRSPTAALLAASSPGAVADCK